MTKADRIQQGQTALEEYYSACKALWIEIDRRQPNPMRSAQDINTFNRLQQEHRLFKFLAGLGLDYDGIKRDILKESPLPSVEVAYATVRRKAARRNILSSTADNSDRTPSSGIGVGTGLIVKGQNRTDQGQTRTEQPSRRSESPSQTVISSSRRPKTDKKCDHCGIRGHLKRDCYHLIGYPEWWEHRDRRTAAEKEDPKRGVAAAAAATVSGPETTGTVASGGGGGHDGNYGFVGAAIGCDARDRSGGGDRASDASEGFLPTSGNQVGGDHWAWH